MHHPVPEFIDQRRETLSISFCVPMDDAPPWCARRVGLYAGDLLTEPVGRWPNGEPIEVVAVGYAVEAMACVEELNRQGLLARAQCFHAPRSETPTEDPPRDSVEGPPPAPTSARASVEVTVHDASWYRTWWVELTRLELASLRDHIPPTDGALDAFDRLVFQLPSSGLSNDDLLVKSVILEDIEATTRLLEQGANPNAEDADGTSVLFHAVAADHVGIASRLLDAGADVHAVELSRAQGRGMAGLLLSHGAQWEPEPGEHELYVAPVDQPLRVLLDKGANPNVVTTNHETPLTFHAHWGNLAAVQALLEAGANPNYKDPEAKISVLGFAADPDDPGTEVTALERALNHALLVPTKLIDAGATINEDAWNKRRQEVLDRLDDLEAKVRKGW